MAANIWVAGPAEIHVGAADLNTLVFLGWAIGGVHISFRPLFRPVACDLAGDMPFDYQWHGETALVTATLSAWDEAVLAQCQSRSNPATGVAGKWPAGAIGSLVIQELLAYNVLVFCPFATKLTQAGQQGTWRFLRGWLFGPDELQPLSPRPKTMRVNFHCHPLYNKTTGGWDLYNHDASGKPVAL